MYNKSNEDEGSKLCSVPPLTGMKPFVMTLDALGMMNLNKWVRIIVSDLIKDVHKICPNKYLVRSFKKDGTQLILQFIQVFQLLLM